MEPEPFLHVSSFVSQIASFKLVWGSNSQLSISSMRANVDVLRANPFSFVGHSSSYFGPSKNRELFLHWSSQNQLQSSPPAWAVFWLPLPTYLGPVSFKRLTLTWMGDKRRKNQGTKRSRETGNTQHHQHLCTCQLHTLQSSNLAMANLSANIGTHCQIALASVFRLSTWLLPPILDSHIYALYIYTPNVHRNLVVHPSSAALKTHHLRP